MKNVFNGWMNAHIQTNSRKLENIGSKVRRHEHEVKMSTHPRKCTKDSNCTCRTGSKLFPKSTVHLSDIISKSITHVRANNILKRTSFECSLAYQLFPIVTALHPKKGQVGVNGLLRSPVSTAPNRNIIMMHNKA